MSETIFAGKDYADLFGWPEYLIFGIVVALSMGIGVFYGFFSSQNKTTDDFLVGGRNMNPFPVSLSLVCSFISGVAMLGDPVEVYYYGSVYVYFLISIIPMIFVVAYFYVPVFCKLRLTSASEYLEMRFDKKTRRVVSFISVIHLLIYMPLTVWAPSLALDQVAGINRYLSSAIIFLTCIAYSSMGGLKAVLWSDALQAFIMLGSTLTILALSVNNAGGFGAIWEIASEGERINFSHFDIDPRAKYTVWTGCVGAFFTWFPLFAGSQGQIQRYLSVPNAKKAQQALIGSLIGLVLVQLPSYFLGLVMYANYRNCDPISIDVIKSSDQLLPLFVMDTLGNITGLPGTMAAGLTCGSLSSVSSALNAIPALIIEDFIKPFFPSVSEKRLGYYSKLISVVFGLISFTLVFVIAAVGSIVPFAGMLHGTLLGPIAGIFTLAFFFPWSNAIGCLSGAAIAMALTVFLAVGTTVNGLNGNLPNQKLSLITEGCYLNSTMDTDHSIASTYMQTDSDMLRNNSWKDEETSGLMSFFSVSYIWQNVISVLGTVIFGLIISVIVNKFSKGSINLPVPSRYMSPLIVKMWRKLLSEETFHYWIDDENKDAHKKEIESDCRETRPTAFTEKTQL